MNKINFYDAIRLIGVVFMGISTFNNNNWAFTTACFLVVFAWLGRIEKKIDEINK